MNGLNGKNVLITGAATEIGQATAIRFAQERASYITQTIYADVCLTLYPESNTSWSS